MLLFLDLSYDDAKRRGRLRTLAELDAPPAQPLAYTAADYRADRGSDPGQRNPGAGQRDDPGAREGLPHLAGQAETGYAALTGQ